MTFRRIQIINEFWFVSDIAGHWKGFYDETPFKIGCPVIYTRQIKDFQKIFILATGPPNADYKMPEFQIAVSIPR